MNHFQTHGWVRIPGAFSAEAAAAMRAVVWRALASDGILRDDPTTWREERPNHLQHLKSDPAFRAVESARTLTAIDEVVGGILQHLQRDAVDRLNTLVEPPDAGGDLADGAEVPQVRTAIEDCTTTKHARASTIPEGLR